MTKIYLREMNEAWQELLKLSMHEAIENVWDRSEEELMECFEIVLATPDDENRPSLFTMMQMTGLLGDVLIVKHKKDENELMEMLKDSNALFVKEIVSE